MPARLDLTDTEWMQLIDGEREDTQLPTCCANISELRDSLIGAARMGGEISFLNQLKQYLHWCFPDHEPTPPLIQKIAELLGEDITEPVEHDPRRELTL